MKLNKLIKRIIAREKYDSTTYVKFLKQKGITIGDNCRIFDPKNTTIDTQNSHMICIGNNVCITSGVKVLTHDYSWVVLAGIYGEITGGVGNVSIGNNVFIGVNSVILKNTVIGDNVIIGAGSIVSGTVESNSVYAGNPAKKIMSIEQFYNKKVNDELKATKKIYDEYYKKFHKKPPRIAFYEYVSLFVNKIEDLSIEEKKLIDRTGYSELVYSKLMSGNSKFKNYEEFIEYISK